MSQPNQAESEKVAFELDLPRGSHLATQRRGYVHHGIYIGNGKVIHYAGLSRHLGRGPVEIVTIEQFAAGFGFKVIAHPRALYTGFEVVRRAVSRLGERNYKLLTNNCEHFCMWCLFGQGKSEQIEACLHNPVHAVALIATLVVCRLAREWSAASSEHVFALHRCAY
jgi:HRAS-like suppressor 3